MKLLKYTTLAVVTLNTAAIPAIANTTISDDKGVAVCQIDYQTALKFSDNTRDNLLARFRQSAKNATIAEKKKQIEQRMQDFIAADAKLRTPEGQKEHQQKCLERYKEDPTFTTCFANATDEWAMLNCKPSKK